MAADTSSPAYLAAQDMLKRNRRQRCAQQQMQDAVLHWARIISQRNREQDLPSMSAEQFAAELALLSIARELNEPNQANIHSGNEALTLLAEAYPDLVYMDEVNNSLDHSKHYDLHERAKALLAQHGITPRVDN